MVIPALILAPLMGAMGVWLANPIGILLTILTVSIYAVLYWRHIPGSLDEWMLLKPEFGSRPENVLDLPISSMEEVSAASEKIQAFCEDHGMGKSEAMYAALCLEEMAGNIVLHGFEKDKKKHAVDMRVVFEEDQLVIRLSDNCIPFNPKERLSMSDPSQVEKNLGIRMVYTFAKDLQYQNILGLNALTVKL